nr:sulfurtransferase [Anaerolineae bacterium]
DWTQDIVEPGSPSQDVAGPERYAALMSRLGIGPQTLVVAYDDAAGMFAARLWWTLHYYGHTRAVVLDGGWQKWLAEGHPVTAVVPQIAPAVFTPQVQPQLRRTADELMSPAAGAGVVLLDVRTPDEFAGRASRARRAGHIPGALNLPRSQLNAPDGTLLPPEQLRLQFAEAGVRLDAPAIITYCNGGVSASYALLALRAAGYTGAALYDGSWKDWGNDPTRPIA